MSKVNSLCSYFRWNNPRLLKSTEIPLGRRDVPLSTFWRSLGLVCSTKILNGSREAKIIYQYSMGSYMKRELNWNYSDNEVYYTACSLLVILNNVCSKLHCQKGLIPFSFQIRSALQWRGGTRSTSASMSLTISSFGSTWDWGVRLQGILSQVQMNKS